MGYSWLRWISSHQLPAELCDFFIPGEDFVYYESPADAIEKAAYFLSHGRERQEIAHNAFEKIAASHTFHHRVQSMFDIIT